MGGGQAGLPGLCVSMAFSVKMLRAAGQPAVPPKPLGQQLGGREASTEITAPGLLHNRSALQLRLVPSRMPWPGGPWPPPLVLQHMFAFRGAQMLHSKVSEGLRNLHVSASFLRHLAHMAGSGPSAQPSADACCASQSSHIPAAPPVTTRLPESPKGSADPRDSPAWSLGWSLDMAVMSKGERIR